MRRPLRLVLALLLAALVAFVVATGLVSRALVRRAAPIAAVDDTPDAETIALTTTDGETIRAWWFDAPDATAVAILLHGNGGSRRSNLDIARFLTGEGCAVLAPTLRAHGDSTGELNDIGWSARHDVVAAVEEAERRAPGRPIVVLGRSLGAAAFLFSAETTGDRIAAVALESPYERLSVAVHNRTDLFLPGPLSWITAQTLLVWGPVWTGGAADRIAPIDHVRHVPAEVPIVVLAGSDDRRASMSEAQAYAAAREGLALEVFGGAGHGELWMKDRAHYEAVLRRLLARDRVEPPHQAPAGDARAPGGS